MQKIRDLPYEIVKEAFFLRNGELWRKGYVDSLGHHRSDKIVRNTGKSSCGYSRVTFNNYSWMFHRIVWMLANQCDIPISKIVDHIDGNVLNNDPSNLRIVDHCENQQNRYTHRKGRRPGCTYKLANRKWQARIQINKHRFSLGMFLTEEEAYQAFLLANKKLRKGIHCD